jgi:hypothetical protein
MWEPQPLTSLRASKACRGENLKKYSVQWIFIKKCILFTVDSFCRVKLFTTGWQTFRWWRRGWNRGVKVVETTVKRLPCYGVWSTSKAMGQVYQMLTDDMSRNKCFSPGSIFTRFTFYIHLWPTYWLWPPSIKFCSENLTVTDHVEGHM